MKSLVVFFALAAVACGSYIPLAQPAHHPAIVLDPHGRPLDTAEVINARAVHLQAKALEPAHYGHAAVAVAPIAHSAVVAAPAVYAARAVYAAPAAAVSHQSRVDVRTSPAIVAHAAPVVTHAAPLVATASVWGAHASPLLGRSALGLAGAGHYLHKRSLGYAWSAPIIAPSAVSHQSRVDVVSSPAVVSHAVAAPVVAHAAPLIAHSAPVVAVAPAAVSHQSRVDVRTSPAIVAHAAPVLATSSVWGAHASPLLGHSAFGLAGAGHYLHKRSLGYAWSAPLIAPSAVSHQSRVDVVSSPAVVSHTIAAPLVAHAAPLVSHAAPIVAVAPAAVSHQSRVDVRTSPAISVFAAAPVAHSYIASAPLVHAAPHAHSVHGW